MNSVHHLVVIAVATLIAACAPASGQRLGSPGDRPEQSRPSVVQPDLEGARFRSTELRELGLGPNGVVMGHWFLSFQGGFVKWRYSDVLESARYEIDANGLIASTLAPKLDPPARTQYDKATDRMFWGGMWYERMAPDGSSTGR